MMLKQILFFFLIIYPSLSFSQTILSDGEKDVVLDRIKELIDLNYVFVDSVESVNSELDEYNLSGKYKQLKEHKDFANALTKDLVEITKDLHFKVQYNPKLISSIKERRLHEQSESENEEVKESEEEINWNEWYAKKENFGFEKAEILDGNIGYLKINFWQPLEWAKPTIDAAMTFISNTDALIIDLTENQGGYSPTDCYLGSYFCSEEPMLWSSTYDRPSSETSSVSTFEEVGGERYLNRPVFILVGKNTFSLAEKFAYHMKHFRKAKIVGQTSAGAAHAIDFLFLNDNFAIQLPISYNIHPVTKTDWEGTGVIPDIQTKEAEALKAAYLKSLGILTESAKKANYESLLKRYDKIRAEINNGF